MFVTQVVTKIYNDFQNINNTLGKNNYALLPLSRAKNENAPRKSSEGPF